ncbi:Extracellular superoxide dismutase [Cu-Zn] [Pseudolycoriella hygida]|uniref:Superoxide dismutase [Cu-Zn] n=1 Tax=Pseudolycoriella hygida TaxID=35572 RepID=A0A9Q0S3R7_9DIPT|nr:Extracellular superoxide dismutase [Cu-Zn] [Pseudolycoriella hygida]
MKTLLSIWAVVGIFGACAGAEDKPVKAVAVLTGDTIKGIVHFTQSGCGKPVLVEVNITGLTVGDHGFHVHEKGDLTDGCASLGAHFNPDKLDHGAPNDEIRHVGDLGNIRADATGVAKTIFSDNLISLMGPLSIVGRGLIVHQDVDDLGKGGHPDSLKTGNAGARAACGIIGYV